MVMWPASTNQACISSVDLGIGDTGSRDVDPCCSNGRQLHRGPGLPRLPHVGWSPAHMVCKWWLWSRSSPPSLAACFPPPSWGLPLACLWTLLPLSQLELPQLTRPCPCRGLLTRTLLGATQGYLCRRCWALVSVSPERPPRIVVERREEPMAHAQQGLVAEAPVLRRSPPFSMHSSLSTI